MPLSLSERRRAWRASRPARSRRRNVRTRSRTMAELLSDYLRDQAAQRPSNIAIRSGREALTYLQLDNLSNRIARALRQAGCRKGDRVCLLAEKSPDVIAAMIGAIKADCSYVPLDIKNPAMRLEHITDISQPRLLLCGLATAGLAERLVKRTAGSRAPLIGLLDAADEAGGCPGAVFSRRDIDLLPDTAVATQGRASAIAHVLFTSGSTGKPKGVPISHSNVIAFVEWAVRYLGIGDQDRLSGHTPLHFDLSGFDIYGTLAAGAELHLVAPELNLLPNKLAEFIRASRLTQWFSVPAVLTHLAKFDAIEPDDFPALKRVLWCGEVLPTPVLIYWMRRLPRVNFTNLYGPTETTIASSYYTVREIPKDPNSPVPIGTACGGEELLVLDERLERVRPGQPGDLYIAGAGLSPGYLNDPGKTEASFLTLPAGDGPQRRIYKTGDVAMLGEDGLLYYLGRNDSQIKSRGYRIEIGEIEAALNAVDTLRESAVVAIPATGFEGNAICCAYVPLSSAALTPASLRARLGKRIPAYMLPHHWIAFDRLPRNSNGKVDRPLLKEEFEVRFGARAASSVNTSSAH